MPSKQTTRPADRKSKNPPAEPAIEAVAEAPISATFNDLGLNEALLRAVVDAGFEAPTPIQARAIPPLLAGRDLIGQAQTGTGKTAAFGLPIIQQVDSSRAVPQALVLAPTRELAVQVAGELHQFAKHAGVRIVPVYGGQPIDRQFRALRAGPHIVVGTPGRILDHLRRASLNLEEVKTCVLDEGDEMLALGFIEDIETILAALPEERQLALFSATMPPRIASLAKRFLREPERVTIEAKRRTVETTNQTYYEVPPGRKLEALARVLDMETPGSTIVFCRTRKETDELADSLRVRGYDAEALHGDMAQPERDRVMKRFREGQSDLLVATDVAARGLDIDSVTHVINYDIPWDVEQYIHRIGRTGRAGRTGDAITLVEPRERRQLRVIEHMIGAKIQPARIPTAADIASRRREIFKDALRETLEEGEFDAHLTTVEELCEEYDPGEIAAAALQILWESWAGEARESDEDEIAADAERPEAGMARLFVSMGRQEGLRPGDLVGAITNEVGLAGKAVGAIDILDHTAFVEVPSDRANDVIAALERTKLRGKRVRVQVARPDAGPPARDGRRERPYPPSKAGSRKNRPAGR
jgi:ATP-dependent RNA helicase DeaD